MTPTPTPTQLRAEARRWRELGLDRPADQLLIYARHLETQQQPTKGHNPMLYTIIGVLLIIILVVVLLQLL